ncbi:hypothetical protein quinque_006423 [Culex quinquefasciatus]
MEQITIFKICDLHMNNRQMIACQPNRESVLDHGSSALQKQVNRILLAADGLRNYHRFGLNSVSKSAADVAEPGRSMDVVRF